jgi:hypothetical protein
MCLANEKIYIRQSSIELEEDVPPHLPLHIRNKPQQINRAPMTTRRGKWRTKTLEEAMDVVEKDMFIEECKQVTNIPFINACPI